MYKLESSANIYFAVMRTNRLLILIVINASVTCLYIVVIHNGPAKPKVIHQWVVTESLSETSYEEAINLTGVYESLPWWQSFLCRFNKRFEDKDEASRRPLKQLFRNITPSRDNANVFLVDTACTSRPRHRVWCSIESWAQQNPDLEIWFVMTSTGFNSVDYFPSSLLQKYPNLHVVGADVEKMFEGTPLLQLFQSRRWTKRNTWPVELMSDMLRVLVLWHWGGVYSDTDVICIRPYNLPLNSLGYETNFQIGSAVYSFRAHHPVVWRLMEDMTKGFEPHKWGSIGPKAITRVVKELCGVEDLEPLLPTAPLACGEVTLFPKATFYPIDYTQSRKFFSKRRGKRFDRIFNHSLAVHFWNKMSKEYTMRKGDFSLYEVAAKRFCPVTYGRSMEESSKL